jgi:hypothetical protein
VGGRVGVRVLTPETFRLYEKYRWAEKIDADLEQWVEPRAFAVAPGHCSGFRRSWYRSGSYSGGCKMRASDHRDHRDRRIVIT